MFVKSIFARNANYKDKKKKQTKKTLHYSLSNSALSSSTAFRSLLSCSGDTASLSHAEHWRRMASRWIAKWTWMMSLNAAEDKMIQDHKVIMDLSACVLNLGLRLITNPSADHVLHYTGRDIQ